MDASLRYGSALVTKTTPYSQVMMDLRDHMKEFSDYLVVQGKSISTVKQYAGLISAMYKRGDIRDPRTYGAIVATFAINTRTLRNAALNLYLRFIGMGEAMADAAHAAKVTLRGEPTLEPKTNPTVRSRASNAQRRLAEAIKFYHDVEIEGDVPPLLEFVAQVEKQYIEHLEVLAGKRAEALKYRTPEEIAELERIYAEEMERRHERNDARFVAGRLEHQERQKKARAEQARLHATEVARNPLSGNKRKPDAAKAKEHAEIEASLELDELLANLSKIAGDTVQAVLDDEEDIPDFEEDEVVE